MVQGGQLRIGVSTWRDPDLAQGLYPPELPESEMLAYYARHFDTVEIKDAFHAFPSSDDFSRWREAVPDGFTFSVPACRALTHLKKLKQAAPSLDLMFSAACRLEDRRGPMLFRLPPRWELNLDRLYAFVRELPGDARFAMEFRDPSWHAPEVYRLLEKQGVALCVHDADPDLTPALVTADFVYLRLRGPAGDRAGSYHGGALRFWKDRIAGWLKQGLDVFVYFDNLKGAQAVRDARELRGSLRARLHYAEAADSRRIAA
jgi:uncharacterized protein YecE (DUF72 family)